MCPARVVAAVEIVRLRPDDRPAAMQQQAQQDGGQAIPANDGKQSKALTTPCRIRVDHKSNGLSFRHFLACDFSGQLG